MGARKPVDVQVAVKPVFAQLLHSAAYEGPCRVGSREDLDPDREKRRGEEQFRKWVQQLRSELSGEARLLDPVKLDWKDDWHIPEGQVAKLDQDAQTVDLFLVGGGGLTQMPALTIAHRFRKPIVMVGTVGTIDVAACLRSRGLEGYAPPDFEEFNRLISLLRVRKAVSQTKILHALEGDVISVGVVSAIDDMVDLENRFGVKHHSLPATRLLDRLDTLSAESLTEAQQLTDELADDAEQNRMSRDDLLASVKFYVTTRSLMQELECNAFAIPCFELCARRIPEKHRVTFCLSHSLLKDEGYPSACEGDTNVLMAMALLMYLSRKAAYMGNCSLLSKPQNLVKVNHDVSARKMKGLTGPDLPYALHPFTVAGWGAALRYDFSRDTGEPVTLARFDPAARKLLTAAGEIVGGEGYDQGGCSLGVHIGVKDVLDYFDKQQDFGHHMAVVYGDYTDELRRLGPILGVDVVQS